MIPRTPGRPRAHRAFAAAPVAALPVMILALFAGCSQEGRTIQNDLVVQGVAADITRLAGDVVSPIDTAAVIDIEFKVQVQYLNGCEATTSGLEIKREGSGASARYVLTPVARYKVDDPCNTGASGDTVITLTVKDVAFVSDASVVNFVVRGAVPGEMSVPADTGLAAITDSTTRYEVRVEDATTGAVAAGALVEIDYAGVPGVIGSGTTGADGVVNLDETCTGTAIAAGSPYTVKVTWAGRTTVLRMRYFPSRCRVRERIVVRV